MQLTNHFSLEEFLYSQTAARLGIENNATGQILANLERLAKYLEEIRMYFNLSIRVSSGYRSPALNAVVPGSSKTSAHCRGLAVDFNVQGRLNLNVARYIARDFCDFDQIIYEFGPMGWVHLGLSDNKPRMQALTAIRRMSGTFYLPGLVEAT